MYSLVILNISLQHVLILLVILILLFGAKKIPELMRGMGTGIKEFKNAVKEEDKTTATHTPPTPDSKNEAPYQAPSQGSTPHNG